MRYVAAYLLAVLGGNATPDVDAIAKILGSVGIECNRDQAEMVIRACHGRNVHELIAEGMEKIGSVSVATAPVSTTESVNVSPQEKQQVTKAPSASSSRSSSPLFGFDDDDDGMGMSLFDN